MYAQQIAFGILVVLLSIGLGVGIPLLVFGRNRDNAAAYNEVIQAYTGLRVQLLEENGRLASMVDELSGDVDALSDKLEEEREKRQALEEQFNAETRGHRNCIREINRLRERVEEFKRQNDAWMQWYMIVLEQFMQLEITPPPDAPAGPLLPRDDG